MYSIKTTVASILLIIANGAVASPLVYLTLLGRPAGSTGDFSHSLVVAPGDLVEYEVVLQMAPIGTSNTQTYPTLTTHTIQYWTPGRAGANSMALDLFQNSSDQVQIDLLAPSNLNTDPSPQSNDSWSAGVGANGGTLTLRPGTANHDLIAIRPIHAPGVFTGVDPEVVLTGSFLVPQDASGASSLVRLRWGTDFTHSKDTGGCVINSGFEPVPINHTTETSADPIVAIDSPLPDPTQTLTSTVMATSTVDTSYALQLTLAPEPSSLALIAFGAGAMMSRRRRR